MHAGTPKWLAFPPSPTKAQGNPWGREPAHVSSAAQSGQAMINWRPPQTASKLL